MGNVWGNRIKLSIFGESHGPSIGLVIGGLPPGLELDEALISREMARRAPGYSDTSTPRKERDAWEIQSGLFNGKTTGAPLCVMIRNENTRSGDYNPDLPRPGHADLTARIKYKGFSDYRGGGHFSGRLTAPLVFAGALAKQILQGICVTARIVSVGGVPNDTVEMSENVRQAILTAKASGDSLGGIIECVASGVPAGLGEPFFDSFESSAASLLFSIPAVKAVEFGAGFGFAAMNGSAANDRMKAENGQIIYLSNNNGGVNGGITNGQPIVCRVCIKPTPTVSREQSTVDLRSLETVTLRSGGRHDPCIVPRAVPVVEAALALCILDFTDF